MSNIPPPPPPSSALPGQVNCQWCLKPMASDSINCPNCGKLRKDIYSEKMKCYTFCGAGGGLVALSSFLLRNHKQNPYDIYNTNDSSGNGLGYVVLIVGVLSAIIGIVLYIKVSQKLKTYWWK